MVLAQPARPGRIAQRGQLLGKNPSAGVKEGAALRPTRSIGDVAGEENVRALVEARQRGGILVSGGQEWKAEVPRLPQRVAQKGAQLGRLDQLLLLCRLQTAGMGETPDGEGGIGKLEKEPGDFHRLLRTARIA